MNQLDSNNINVVVLAAGQGKRMGIKDLPKVLAPLDGKPLIKYVVDSIHKSGIFTRPVIVVGFHAEKVKEELGEGYDYAFQAERLGTGHAVKCAENQLASKSGSVLVLYGDMPLISSETITELAKVHANSRSVLAMATVTVTNFNDWRQGFVSFGRVVRNIKNQVESIVEAKDATPEQLQIKECNPAVYCFEATWLWKNLEALKNNNSQGEYYLTDLVAAAKKDGFDIPTIDIDPCEAVGINTEDELGLVSRLMDDRVTAI